ncbi:hypothetical protein Tco_0737309 [Tanacetum coccineum]
MPPITDDWDRLFQLMFDEYFNPLPIAVSPVQEAAAPRAEVLADSPVSTSIDQDALSTNSTSQGSLVTDIHEKTKTKLKPDKTEHEIEKSMENRSRRRMHLNGPTRPKLTS